ncbi:MAG TPA: hypothetical protein VKB78_14360, partial [Pirellulales bacterium]|nr:hypothetical protein [Pirellulales bacterium]
MIQWWHVRVLTELGRTAEACAVCKALVESKNMAPDDRASGFETLAEMLAKRGSKAEALDAISHAEQLLDDKSKAIDAGTAKRIKNQLEGIKQSLAAKQ